MSQFMYAEVKFKDFRKVTIPKFDSTKQDSFVHRYKSFCSTWLQWGVWCPLYESAQARGQYLWILVESPPCIRPRSRLLYVWSDLLCSSFGYHFPSGSKEQSAIEGCPSQCWLPCTVCFAPSASSLATLVCVLNRKRNPKAATFGDFQPLHSQTPELRGSRTTRDSDIHGIGSPRPRRPKPAPELACGISSPC
jgi:hypothetical protein